MKRFLAAVAVAPIAISSAAVAGPYINADIESSFYDGEYHMSQTGLHLGYKDVKGKLEYHIQGGPLLTEVDNPDDAGIEIDYSAKAGVSYAVNDNVDVYQLIQTLENYAVDPEYTKKLLAVTLGLFEKYPHLFKSEEIWEYYKNNKNT